MGSTSWMDPLEHLQKQYLVFPLRAYRRVPLTLFLDMFLRCFQSIPSSLKRCTFCSHLCTDLVKLLTPADFTLHAYRFVPDEKQEKKYSTVKHSIRTLHDASIYQMPLQSHTLFPTTCIYLHFYIDLYRLGYNIRAISSRILLLLLIVKSFHAW